MAIDDKTMNPADPPTRTVACPTCKGPSRYSADNPWRPFCCERCRNLDLGAWASEGFRLPVEPTLDADEPPTHHSLPH